MWVLFVRWWVVLLGGVLLGAGLVLYGQVALAIHSREQVQDVFFIWRGIGQMTFVFQDDQTKMALWMNEIPEEVVRESRHGAWTLMVIGAVLALTATALRPCREKRRKSNS